MTRGYQLLALAKAKPQGFGEALRKAPGSREENVRRATLRWLKQGQKNIRGERSLWDRAADGGDLSLGERLYLGEVIRNNSPPGVQVGEYVRSVRDKMKKLDDWHSQSVREYVLDPSTRENYDTLRELAPRRHQPTGM